MAVEKAPAFQFYPKDFLSSDAVSLMTTEQIGAYTLLLCHSWLRPEGLPSDLPSLAKLARVPVKVFTSRIWPVVSKSFTANDGGLLFNPRMERGRGEYEQYRTERSQSGKRGAAARWGMAQPSIRNGSAIKEPLAKHSSSSASASASASTTTQNVVVVGAVAPQQQPRTTPIFGRRNPDLMTYGPIPLWASQFRDQILPLVAAHHGGDRDKADGFARVWIGELDAANQATTPSAEDVKAPARWWQEQAAARWSAADVDRGAENIRKWLAEEAAKKAMPR